MINRALIILLLLVLLLAPCFGGTPPPETQGRAHTLTLSGLEDAYNFDFGNAVNKFDEAISLDPSFPRPYLSKASLSFWQFVLSKSDSDYNSFLPLIDDAIRVGEKYLDEHGDDAEVLACLGTSYGYRSFAHARIKSYLKSAWDGKKSYDYLYDAVRRDPKLYDAYLGLGLYHYYLTFVPKPLQWIISVLGISGDSELGIKELRAAAENGTYTKTEAKYYLATILPWHSGDFDASEKILADLSTRYPQNTVFTFSRAVWELRRNDVCTAKSRLSGILRTDNNSLPALKTFARYKLAECHFRLDDYAQALAEYDAFQKENHDETYKATSNYRVGICCELLGKRASAMPYYGRAAKADPTFGDDAYSARRAGKRLKTPLTQSDTALIRAENALKSGNYDKALALFMDVKNSSACGPEEIAEAEYGAGEALYEKGAYDEARQHFQIVIGLAIQEERWLLPWAHYQSALCWIKLNNILAAKKELEQALEYDDYDFKGWLNYRAGRELEALKKKSG